MDPISLAKDLISAAKLAGADCVKFQTFKAERVVQSSAPKAAYQNLVTNPNESQLAMLKRLELRENHYLQLIDHCKNNEILFTSTPYNEEDIEFLQSLDVPILKAASIHIAEPRFLQRMAETGIPLVISTGMATWDEIDEAVKAISATGNNNFVLLQCTTNYPSLVEDTNLNAISTMKSRYKCPVGYSDHTQSHTACIASVSLGVKVIEKHLTIDTSLEGPDHSTSETPERFKQLVDYIREAELSLGSSDKFPSAAELANMRGMRRSGCTYYSEGWDSDY